MEQHKHEPMRVPRLSKDVKELNGKSTERLHQCLDALEDLLDADEVKEETTQNESQPLRDTGTD
jgi:hypothetical protein